MIIKFLIVIAYIIIGAVLLGLLYYTAATKQPFKDFYSYMGLMDELNDLNDVNSAIGFSVMFAVCWPILIVFALIIMPYIYIKYMFDKKWGK